MTNENAETEQISELVEYILEGMDMETLESFVRENLTEYYSSEDGAEDLAGRVYSDGTRCGNNYYDEVVMVE